MYSEFEFIQNIKKTFGLAAIGDDCAVLPKNDKTDLLVTADLLVEDVDFRLDWTTPEMLGHKALAVSLSDIAAMGGEARWAMFSLGVPETTWNSDFLDRFYTGAYQLAKKFGVEIVGGDVSRTPYGLAIDSVVGGDVPHGGAVRRTGAHPGDLILVTGELGGAAGGLRLLREGIRYSGDNGSWQHELLLKQLEPWPQMGSGLLLQMDDTATAMIDVSDGLSSDLAHICRMSRVGARIDADRIPVNSNLQNLGSDEGDMLSLALNGGEDFELLFTARHENISDVDEELFTVIGEVTATVGVIELFRDGITTDLTAEGFRHF